MRANAAQTTCLLVEIVMAMACSGSDGEAAEPNDVGAAPVVDASVPSEPACSDGVLRIVDYVSDIPEVGRGDVQMPDIAVNATHVYYLSNWSEPRQSGRARSGALMRAPLVGGPSEQVAALAGGGSQRGQSLALTESAVIYFSAMEEETGGGAIMSAPIATQGRPRVLTATVGPADALVVDANAVYFVDGEATKRVPLNEGLGHRLGGGVAEILSAMRPHSIGLGAGELYLADYSARSVSSLSLETGVVTELASQQPVAPLYPLSCGGSDVCWATVGAMTQGTVVRLTPGKEPLTIGTGFSQPGELLFDGESLFLSSGAGGAVLFRFALDGSAKSSVTAGAGLSNIAVDDECLYWSDLHGIFSLRRDLAGVANASD